MSSTVDNRVVEMRFDNKQFESGVQTSMSTLEKLKQSLNLTGAAKGLENINSASNKVDLTPLSNAAQTVGLKFNAIYTMADQAFRNITNSAYNAGIRIAKSLSVDQISSGWSKYEQKTASVQTIMNATGKDIDEVNRYLDKLMWYSDETSYGFTDMTQSLAQLTSAGGNIDNLIPMIEGIANATAFAGKGANEFSRAIYNLNQSYSAGYMQYMDWKSLDLAGVSSKQLKQVFIDTAKSMGKLTKEGKTAKGTLVDINNFGQTLNEQWADTEVMEAAFGKFAELTEAAYEAVEAGQYDTASEAIAALANQYDEIGVKAFKSAQEAKSFTEALEATKDAVSSGWMKTMELIFGNYDEAKVLWTDVANGLWEIFASGAESRNEVLDGALTSNWDKFADGLEKAGVSMETYEKKVREVAKEHGMTDKDIDILIDDYGSLENAIKKGKISNDILKKSIDKTVPAVSKMAESLKGLVDDGLGKLGGRELAIEGFKNAIAGIANIVKPVKEAFENMFPPMTAENLYSMIEGFHNLTEKFKEWTESAKGQEVIGNLVSTFEGFFSVIDIGWTFVKDLASGIRDLLGNITGLGGGLLGVTGSIGNWLTGLRDSIKQGDLFGKAIDGIVGFLQNGIAKIKEFASSLKIKFNAPGWDGFRSVMSGIWDLIQKIGSAIGKVGSAIGSALSSIFTGGTLGEAASLFNSGLFAALLLGLKKFVGSLTDIVEGGGGIFEGLKGSLDSLKGCLEAWQKDLQANALLKIAAAVGILAVSLALVSAINPDKLANALGAITVLFADLMGSMKLLTMMDTKGTSKAMGAMIAMSLSVLILASALKTISDVSWEGLAKGLVGVLGLMAIVVAATKVLSMGSKGAVKGALQMVLFAAAVKILASVCKDLASLTWEELGKGLVGVGVLMAEISLFLNTAKFSGKSISTALGIVLLSAALKILASVCKDFSAMSWEDIGKGLAAIGGLLAELAIFTKLTGNAKHVISTGLALVLIGASMKIFASAVSDFAAMSWEDIGKGLAAMAGALLSVAIASRLMPKNLIGIGAGLVVTSAALLIIAEALGKMGGMSWDSVGKSLASLGGSMLILVIGLNAMKGAIGGAAALLVASAALALIAPALERLGGMSWESIGKALVTLAGAFLVIGVAGALLTPIIPAILGLGAAFLLLGIGVAAIGGGLAAIAAAFGVLATAGAAGAAALVASLTIIISGIASMIPLVVRELGNGIIEFCKVIGESATVIGQAFKDIVLVLIDVVVECVPALVDGLLVLLDSLLTSLVTYAPKIIDGLVDLLIGVIDGLAARIPDLMGSLMGLVTSLFTGIADAFLSLDPSTLVSAGLGVAIMAALMGVLGLLAPLIPGALAGVLGLGVFIAELAIVIAAIGALAQIPGLDWLISEGSTLMQQLGTAIGAFVGGIVGGVAEGLTGSLPNIASNLSAFMTNLEPFISGAQKIDASMMDGVDAIADIILKLTGANILEGLTAWFTGGSSLAKFASELVEFGTGLKGFSDAVAGVDPSVITNAANAASALIGAAATIPNSGGIVSWFTGDQDLSAFSTQLKSFGEGLKGFADSASGIDPSMVTTASEAATALISAASTIPNTGGIVGWFTGEQDLTSFSTQLKSFGEGIKSFADGTSGVDPAAVTTASEAASALISAASTIPSTGGVVGWFTGEKDLSSFGSQLGSFGAGIKSFADAAVGLDTASVETAANAASTLIGVASTIPSVGGVVGWFTGEKDLTSFGTQLSSFGQGIKNFATETTGIDTAAISSSVDAASTLISAASTIPNTGGVVGWFTGEKDLSSFGSQLSSFGKGIKSFADETVGVDSATMTAAANAASTLMTAASSIPETGGILGWFTGSQDLSSFGSQLKSFGQGIKNFADETAGISAESTGAATKVAESLSTLASGLENDKVNNLGNFGNKIKDFGGKMKSFSKDIAEVDTTKARSVASAANTLATMTSKLSDTAGINNIGTFANKIGSLGSKLKSFSTNIAGLDTAKLKSVATDVKEIATTLASITGMEFTGATALSTTLTTLGKTSVDKFISSFTNAKPRALLAANGLLMVVANGIIGTAPQVINAATKVAKDALSAIKSVSFTSAGKHVVQGFANGISANLFMATSAAREMAKAALKAAKAALGIASPSKEFYAIGEFSGEGFINALGDYESKTYKAGSGIAESARKGLGESISKVQKLLESGFDDQLTIRPVLDLSEVVAGANSIEGMFDANPSIGAMSNIGAISLGMHGRQNGGNGDVISAIEKLGNKLGNISGNTTNVNGVTYDDGSNVSEAVKTLVRATRIERRR